jgi:hypothetical protein
MYVFAADSESSMGVVMGGTFNDTSLSKVLDL